MYEILILLAKSTPVIAVLWLSIKYLLKKEKEYQNKINELQLELRKNEKSSLSMMNKLVNVLDKLNENNLEDKKEIMDELKNIHKDLTDKLEQLKRN
jgi:translation initiation factor 2B subunit (eIF-2B alpha/beta/delta family)